MRILIDVRTLARGGATGIGEYTRELVDALLAREERHNYILFANSFRRLALPDAWRRDPRVTIVNWHIPNKFLDILARSGRAPFVDERTRADLVWSPHFHALPVRTAPRIVTFHDLAFLHHPDFFSVRQRFWHWLQDYPRQARAAQAIVTVSAFTKHDLIHSLEIPPERIHAIPSGINPRFRPIAENNPARQAFKTAHGLHAPFILSLCTLEPRKNVNAIIRAFSLVKRDARFHNLELVIAGRPGWLYRRIFKEAERSPFRNHIRFFGFVAPDDRPLLYNLASLFVYPSFFEGFGFPPLEAQACGTPIIVSDRTALAEVVGASGLRVNPWSVEELADGIRKILTTRALHRKLKEEGLTNVSAYTWQLTAARMHTLFTRYAKTKDRS